jgi:hypothetical protein
MMQTWQNRDSVISGKLTTALAGIAYLHRPFTESLLPTLVSLKLMFLHWVSLNPKKHQVMHDPKETRQQQEALQQSVDNLHQVTSYLIARSRAHIESSIAILAKCKVNKSLARNFDEVPPEENRLPAAGRDSGEA